MYVSITGNKGNQDVYIKQSLLWSSIFVTLVAKKIS